MHRVNISLPEEIMLRLEPIKDRINISQVCREAIEGRIATFERASEQGGTALDVNDLITRFRKERALVEGRWENLGKQNAATWLLTVSYVELINVVEHTRTPNFSYYKLPHSAFRMMRHDMEKSGGSLEGPPSVAYKTAWLDYVTEISDQIKGELEHVEVTHPSESPQQDLVTDTVQAAG